MAELEQKVESDKSDAEEEEGFRIADPRYKFDDENFDTYTSIEQVRFLDMYALFWI